MGELVVTRIWMGGVVAMMLLFAAIALVGYLQHRRREQLGED